MDEHGNTRVEALVVAPPGGIICAVFGFSSVRCRVAQLPLSWSRTAGILTLPRQPAASVAFPSPAAAASDQQRAGLHQATMAISRREATDIVANALEPRARGGMEILMLI